MNCSGSATYPCRRAELTNGYLLLFAMGEAFEGECDFDGESLQAPDERFCAGLSDCG
jgi:hypothetical protein